MAYKASNHHSFLFLRCCSAQGKETSDANLCQMNGTKINQESSYLKDQEQNDVVQPPSEVQTKDKSKSYKETTTRERQEKQILVFCCVGILVLYFYSSKDRTNQRRGSSQSSTLPRLLIPKYIICS